MRELAERAYFHLCQALGWLLRSARYSKARVVGQEDGLHVRKRRVFYAPLLIWMSDPLLGILDAGVRVLPRKDWVERERVMYRTLHGASIRIDAEGALLLPFLAGETLAALLENPTLTKFTRRMAIERAVVALAEFHRLGFTHADAMAENVLVDLGAGVAHWFDFETIHAANRSMAWRRSDDLRALLTTCLVRTVPGERTEIFHLILDVYQDEAVTRVLAASFASAWQRPLAIHFVQARLSFPWFKEIGRLLRERQ